MLTLRPPQVQALDLAILERFDDEMLAMLGREFPVDAELLGDEGARPVVALARERAQHHRLPGRGAVAAYLCLMMVLGSYFDEDPQLPWAAQALKPPRVGPSSATMDHLLSLASAHLARTAGPRGLAFLRTLRKVAATEWEELCDEAPGRWFRELYPPKAELIGTHEVIELERRGVEMAQRWRLDPLRGGSICAGTMLMLGSGCERDPLYPWFAAAIVAEEGEAPLAHTRRLWTRLRDAAAHGLETRIRILGGE